MPAVTLVVHRESFGWSFGRWFEQRLNEIKGSFR